MSLADDTAARNITNVPQSLTVLEAVLYDTVSLHNKDR